MKKLNKIYFLIGLILIVILVSGQILFHKKEITTVSDNKERFVEISISAQKQTITPAKQAVTVEIVFGGSGNMTGSSLSNNAYQVLNDVVKSNKIGIETKQYKFGLMVEKIGDRKNSTSAFWSYSVNGKMGNIAADKYLVYPGDKVVWKYGQ
ncbi:hypothetical protein A2Y99_01940 [Candidatus Gottesmanbacteria bacterium RBG_13_37_7]|uniref:Transcobalamin-like C-terminal domain-containing protein n=1 Tax=Candidatus Gottesmanbacteria bacterium RBG_13_37_7 TaxID=1798369 RepID=A0A1F5YI20_9BACT|nr:MAG: hypothetical protein A2Y99_01940 [Candidatus Gottesmanbacteria bacterium RBG_13_37_7]